MGGIINAENNPKNKGAKNNPKKQIFQGAENNPILRRFKACRKQIDRRVKKTK
jgi:hypothetical protein